MYKLYFLKKEEAVYTNFDASFFPFGSKDICCMDWTCNLK